MLPDGRYSVWFRTPLASGVGVIEIADQRVSGRDTVMEYFGSFIQDGNAYRAEISIRRHSPGHAAMLALDDVEVDFTGTSRDTTASGTGRVRQLPHVALDVVLVRIDDAQREVA